MKLYFSPGACSLSPHIVLEEAGLPFDIEQVNLATKKTKGGDDFTAINSKGYVPALKLDSGEVLSEGPAIVQYLADLKPESKLAPPAGTIERVRLQEYLNFITAEIHKAFSPLFDGKAPDEIKQAARDKISKRVAWLSKELGEKPYLLGDTFTVADAYLFTVLRWTGFGKIDLGQWPNIKSYFERIQARPAVVKALAVEYPDREAAQETK